MVSRRVSAVMGLLGATGTAVVMQAKPASAYQVTGNRWASSNPYLSYWTLTTIPGYVEAADNAASRWNASNIPVTFAKSQGYPLQTFNM